VSEAGAEGEGDGEEEGRRRRKRDSGGSFEIGAACLQSEIRYTGFSIIS
jgi:hypothetical protein